MKARRVRRGAMVACPFCRFPCSTTNPGQWCAGCFVRWRLTPGFVVFDPNMKARSFGEALAVALAKSGGVKIGEHDKEGT